MDDELIKLGRQNEILERRVRNLENYVKQLAHDLKTPLTPLVGASEFLASGFTEQPWCDLAQSIKISAENLLRMVDELLDLELCECGKIKFNFTSFDAVKPVAEETRKVEAGLPVNRLAITLDLPATPVLVWADELRLRQVISIFLLNALKFSPGGGKLTVRVIPGEATTGFAVEDEGPQIASSDLPHFFDPYSSDGQHRRVGTSSLVLAKRLIELQGGNIGARSVPERGNTLWFDLPVEKSNVFMGAV